MADTCSQGLIQEDNMCTQAKIQLARNLSSPDKTKRDKAMSLVCLWLTSQKDVKEEELLKIWKGLFYCVWHAEKAPAQADLINRMAYLMEKLDVDLSLLFFKVFLTALRREWGSIDKRCLDSFYLLLRQYVSHMFVVLQINGWELEVVRKFMDALVERAFLAQDAVVADAVNLHIADIFFHELKCFLPIPIEIFEVLLEPFWITLAKGCDKTVAERISEKVFLVLFNYGCRALASKQEGQGLEEKDDYFGTVALTLPLSSRTKNIALLPFITESNSVLLNLIQEKFMALENLSAQSGISISTAIRDNAAVKINQTESKNCADTASTLADGEEAKVQSYSISHLQLLSFRTFGRRSKRNQKLAFSPQADDGSLANEDVPSEKKPGDTLEEEGSMVCMQQAPVVEAWNGLDKMISTGKKQEHTKGRVFGEVMSSYKNQMDMAFVRQLKADGKETIEDGDLFPEQDAAMGEEDTNGMNAASEDGINMEDSVISNLAKRFDSIADESTCLGSCPFPKVSTPLAPSPINTGSRKRKSWRNSPMDFSDAESPTSTKENNTLSPDSLQGHNGASIENMSVKKAKKVHFSLKHNLVWRPSTPLPPHSLRVPPSATPRGSALKKGVPPGPILVLSENSVSPKKKKKATPKKAPSAAFRSPRSLKNSARGSKLTKKGHHSPR